MLENTFHWNLGDTIFVVVVVVVGVYLFVKQ
jgi:hypothetical protein